MQTIELTIKGNGETVVLSLKGDLSICQIHELKEVLVNALGTADHVLSRCIGRIRCRHGQPSVLCSAHRTSVTMEKVLRSVAGPLPTSSAIKRSNADFRGMLDAQSTRKKAASGSRDNGESHAGQDIHKNAFREEAHELLSELEQSLMELEENPEDKDLVSRVFRAMHTIKGSGAMFGFDAISKFTHEVETTFDLVRTGKMAVSKKLIDLTLAARDQIKLLLDKDDMDVEDEAEIRSGIIAKFRELIGQSTKQSAGIGTV